jgi:hypothetical protein
LPAANTETMSLHLAAISSKVAPGSHAALVIDGAGYHTASALAVPDNITLVRLPPYAPELNPIENVWEYLRANKLAITVFNDYDDIVDKTCAAWNGSQTTQNASPPSPRAHGRRSISKAVGMIRVSIGPFGFSRSFPRKRESKGRKILNSQLPSSGFPLWRGRPEGERD